MLGMPANEREQEQNIVLYKRIKSEISPMSDAKQSLQKTKKPRDYQLAHRSVDEVGKP